MKKIYLALTALVAGLFVYLPLQAQVNGYLFSQSNGTYVPITTGTVVGQATNALPSASPEDATMDDFTYPAVALPFNFSLGGASYSSININTNGWVSFGATTTSTSLPISSSNTYSGVIASMALDLMGIYATTATRTSGSEVLTEITNTGYAVVGAPIQGEGIPAGTTIVSFDATSITMSAAATAPSTGTFVSWATGDIRTDVTGIAPNRTFIIQFSGMSLYSGSASATSNNTSMSFQVHLHEAGGDASMQTVSIVYGSLFRLGGSSSTQVGLRGLTNADYSNRTTTTNWAATTAGSSNGSTATFSNTVFPASGLTFTWAPNNAAMDWCNLQWPASGSISQGSNLTVYTQGYEAGVTEAAGAGTGILAWVGVSSTNTDPSTWTTWIPATFNVQSGNNDEFQANIGSTLGAGTWYYASRWQLTGGAYRYGGYNSGGGGFWDGTNNISGVLTVTPAPPPTNDDICGAISLTVSPTGTCTTALTGQSSLSATQSLPGCVGTADEDVWYSFVATSATHVITLSISGSGATDRVHQVFSSSDNTCTGTLTSISCSDPETSTLNGLTVGNTYFVRVYSYSSTPTLHTTFDICVTIPVMTFVSSTTTQSSTASVTAGTVNQQIVRLQLVVNGLLSPLSVSQIDFNTGASTSPASDIVNAKVYYTGTSTSFSTTTQFGSAVASPSGAFSVTGSQVLTGGNSNTSNYFWLVYDIACNATPTNVVDAQINGVVVETPQVPTVSDPTGTRTIVAPTTTATTNQPSTASVITGAVDAQVLRVALTSCAGSTVTSIDFGTTGSTNAVTDISAARVYFTTTTTFATTTFFGSAVAAPNGAFTVTGSQALATGTGYFWLVYDVAPGATPANVIDAECTGAVIDGNTVTPATPNPTGTRTIVAALVNDNASGAITIALGATCTGGAYTNVNGSLAANEPRISCKGSQTAGSIVWFKFVAPASGFVKVSTDISGGGLTDTRLGVFSATNANDYSTFNIIACDDDNGATVTAASVAYANGLTPGATYYVGVDHWNGTSTGTFCVEVTEVTSSMVASGTSCTSGQSLSGYRAEYTGWLSLTDLTGNLTALIKYPAGTPPATYTFNNSLTINAAAVRQSPQTNGYYLDRNFRIENTTATNVDVQFFFLNAELVALNTADGTTLGQLAVTRQTELVAGCQANFDEANGESTLIPQTASGSANGVSWVQINTPGFSNFYLHNVGQVLPISIEYFKGSKQSGGHLLDWKVSCTGSPSVTMELERSSDARHFTAINAQTETAARCLQPFSYTDNAPVAGINYYRLKSIDIDGKVSYSNIVALLNKDKGFEIVSLAPNPAKDVAVLSITTAQKGIIEIVLSDVSGKQMSKQRVTVIAGNNQLPLQVAALPSGTYHVTAITADGATQTLRFMKQ